MEGIQLTPEFALVQVLETVPGMKGRITALQPKKGVKPPFAFYVSNTDDEVQALDGGTGLQSYTATLHLVSDTFHGLQLLCAWAKKVIRDMKGASYWTPENAPEDVLQGQILVEDANVAQSSPDLYEAEVCYYRRMYTVRIDYQTEEVLVDDD